MCLGNLKFIIAFLTIGVLSIKILTGSLKEGQAAQSLPSSVIFKLSGYPIKLSITTVYF